MKKEDENMMIREAIHMLANKENLTFDVAKASMDEIMSGDVSQAQLGSFLMGLVTKGETIDEITAFAQVMREKAAGVDVSDDVLEIVGTGGDEAFTFNISTTAGFVIAAAGVKVAKHGNRSVSSKCGAADVLEELGAVLELDGIQTKQVLDEVGMCFMFAPMHHQSMKHVAPVRKDLGIRTVFNILGPLSNPAGATIQLMGVYDKSLVEPLAQVLSNLGVKRGAVVYGYDGLDEITACDKTFVCEIQNGQLVSYDLDPRHYGFELAKPGELTGGDKVVNAAITRAILEGEQSGKRTAVLLNAGMSIHLAKPELTLDQCIHMAEDMIDSGKALDVLRRFVAATQRIGVRR